MCLMVSLRAALETSRFKKMCMLHQYWETYRSFKSLPCPLLFPFPSSTSNIYAHSQGGGNTSKREESRTRCQAQVPSSTWKCLRGLSFRRDLLEPRVTCFHTSFSNAHCILSILALPMSMPSSTSNMFAPLSREDRILQGPPIPCQDQTTLNLARLTRPRLKNGPLTLIRAINIKLVHFRTLAII